MRRRFETLLTQAVELVIALSISDRCRPAQERCILLSCHDVDRGLERGGAFFSPILSPIGEYYRKSGRRVVNLSHPLTLQRSRRVFASAVSVNRGFIYTGFIEKIESVFFGKDAALARKRARRVGLYDKVLQKTRPLLVFSIQPPHELCIAARQRGIAVIEAMHGMNLHPSDRIFRGFYEGVEDRRLPAAFLAFDSRTQATLTSLLDGRALQALQVPHPWHVEVRREESQLVSGTEALVTLAKRYRAAMLVTLQWGYDGERASLSHIIPNGIIHPALEAAIASSSKDILWLLRLHPIQMRRLRYRKHRAYVRDLAARHPNVEVHLASTLPLPVLLSKCSGHLTMTSGSAGEAALLGVPSLMLCPTLKSGGAHEGWFSELVDSGMVTFGELDKGAIASWISSRLSVAPTRGADWEQQRKELEEHLDRLLEGKA